MPGTRPPIAQVIASIGLLCMVGGSFLSWFHSGAVERNSYQAVALADHFAVLDNTFLGTILRFWVGMPALGAVCAVLFALGITRSGAILTAALGISVGTVAVVALVQSKSDGFVGITSTGPIATILGTITALAGALGAVITSTRRRRTRPARKAGIHQ